MDLSLVKCIRQHKNTLQFLIHKYHMIHNISKFHGDLMHCIKTVNDKKFKPPMFTHKIYAK